MNAIRHAAVSLAACAAASTALAAATIESAVQDPVTGKVTVRYTLDAPVVVTLDVTTNCEGRAVSIGRDKVARAVGDVNMLISGTESVHTAYWFPFAEDGSAAVDLGAADIVLRTWATNAPPDYMVINVANTGRIHYYEDVCELPYGIDSDAYRTDMFVMRRIHAANVAWEMSAGNSLHMVTLTNDYYIAVFEMTHQQCENITGWAKGTDKYSRFKEADSLATRPVDWMRLPSYSDSSQGMRYPFNWPNEDREVAHKANEYCLVGKMRTKTGLGVYLDLPTEAQWEYAARAGTSRTALPDGTSLTVETGGEDPKLSRYARYKYNGGYVKDAGGTYSAPDYATATAANGTARVGSYEPNAWGLYDMLGNVAEWCLDRYAAFTSDPVTDPVGAASGNMSVRGGHWASEPNACKLYSRTSVNHWIEGTAMNPYYGIRMCLTLQGAFAAPTEVSAPIGSAVRCGEHGEADAVLGERFSTFPVGTQFRVK